MKVALNCCVTLLIALVGVTAQAMEPLALYDDFDSKLIDPARWFGSEEGNAGREAIREIHGNRLRLVNRAYGNTNSNSGRRVEFFRLNFDNPAAITTIVATVRVEKFEAMGCPSNSTITAPLARLAGFFFNTGTPTPGSRVNDVFASVYVTRRSDSTDQEDVLRVHALVLHCTAVVGGACTGPLLGFHDLGPIKREHRVRLRVQWDQANHLFIFQRDDEPEVFSPYAVSDSVPPSSHWKYLAIFQQVANCTDEPRPTAFMEALFDDVFVNESAAP